MYRYKCTVSYDGSQYMGYQIQGALPTVELKITEALEKLVCREIKIYSSGRTDRYVHALNQVFHFDLDSFIPPKGIKDGANAYLPRDIYIKSAELVDSSFHARFSAVSKEYRYYIYTGEYNPLVINYASHIQNLNIDRMRKALSLFAGTHDFKGFSSAGIDPRKDTVKTIFHTELKERGEYLEFVFVGNGFLKYQVRRMMGLLIEIGRGKEESSKMLEVFAKRDSSISNRVADGCGLYLVQVNYN